MITEGDSAILAQWVTNWEKEIKDYVDRNKDKIVGRAVLPTRTVGPEIQFDVVTHFDRTGPGAQILAKGQPPQGSGMKASNVPFEMFQVVDGVLFNDKDLKLYPKGKPNMMDAIMKSINHRENIATVFGDAPHAIKGIKGLAEANTAGVFTAIKGPWDGSGAKRDIYEDLVNAKAYLKSKFSKPRFLLGNALDLNHLLARMDVTMTEKYWQECAAIFGKKSTDPLDSWAIEVVDEVLPRGYVYMTTFDPEAAEFVISENPTLRPAIQQPGGNLWTEIYEWIGFEGHDAGGFVKIKIT